jgi:hypothetical protein
VLLVLPGAAVLRVFAITGMDQVIPSFTTLDEALATAEGRSCPRKEGDALAEQQPIQRATCL